MRGINPFEFAKSGREEEMKGINPFDYSDARQLSE